MTKSSVTPIPSPKRPGLLISRNFALLWSGQIVSFVGDFIFETTLVLWIVTVVAQGQPWAAAAVSGMLLAAAVPVLIVGPIAGVFVDRWHKRRTMLWMDAMRTIVIVLLFLSVAVHPPLLWQLGLIYSTVFIASACAQFFEPSLLTLIGDIVDAPYRAHATGLIQLMASLAAVIGPSVATLLFFTMGIQGALLLNALSFVVSFMAILAIRQPEGAGHGELEHQSNFLREFGQGIRFYTGNPVLMTILISGVLVVFIHGALNALDIFFVTSNLHTSVRLYGLLSTALGAGLTVGALLTGTLAHRLGLTNTFWLALLAGGGLVLVYARLTRFVPALVTLFLLGLVTTAVNVVAGPLLLHVTPRALIGRVTSVLMPALNLATMFSIAIAGYVYSTVLHSFHATLMGITFGPADTIFTVTGIFAILGGLFAMVRLRRIPLDAQSAMPAET